MFYAIRLCGNPNRSDYQKPIDFIKKDSEREEVLCFDTEEEMEQELKGWELYEAGWIEIVELDI